MWKLAMMIAVVVLTGCSSIGTSGTRGADGLSFGAHNDPFDMTYRGGAM